MYSQYPAYLRNNNVGQGRAIYNPVRPRCTRLRFANPNQYFQQADDNSAKSLGNIRTGIMAEQRTVTPNTMQSYSDGNGAWRYQTGFSRMVDLNRAPPGVFPQADIPTRQMNLGIGREAEIFQQQPIGGYIDGRLFEGQYLGNELAQTPGQDISTMAGMTAARNAISAFTPE